MPYICLARGDIPDGVVQVLDLLPNSSQRIPSLTPPGESRYVNRVKRGTAGISLTGGLLASGGHVDGLEAYFLDRIEPGGLEQAVGSFTILAGLANGETVSVNGVTFTAVAHGTEVAANQTFASVTSAGGSIADTVTTLTAALNHANSRTLMEAGTIAWSYVTATAANPAVTLVAKKAGAALLGWAGNVTLAKSAAHVTLSGSRLTRTHEVWTSALLTTVADAFVNHMDAGLSLTLSDINGGLSSMVGAELTSLNGSQSVGTVAGVLDCLAGRTFRAPVRDTTGRAASSDVDADGCYYYMDSTYPTFKWHATTGRGGFTQMVLNNGSGMSDGEIKPSTIGGDTENREVGGIRHTYNVDALTASLVVGQLSKMTTSTLLWPTTHTFPHFPFGQAGFTEYDPTTAPRLVIVYDDDGTVL